MRGFFTVLVVFVMGCGDSGENNVMPDAPRPDGSVIDASHPDAAMPDAREPDAPIPDAPPPDAPPPDAAMPDAGVPLCASGEATLAAAPTASSFGWQGMQ